jgi:prolipoprotein diacylglyceryltransferase
VGVGERRLRCRSREEVEGDATAVAVAGAIGTVGGRVGNFIEQVVRT